MGERGKNPIAAELVKISSELMQLHPNDQKTDALALQLSDLAVQVSRLEKHVCGQKEEPIKMGYPGEPADVYDEDPD
jgi:hypothetical protein